MVLLLMLTLAACGQKPAVSETTADTVTNVEQESAAELEELQTADNQPEEEPPAESEPEKETVTILEEVVSRVADWRGRLPVHFSHPVPEYGLALDCVKHFSYDEYGNATEEDIWYSPDEVGVYMYPSQTFDNGSDGLDVTRDSDGQAIAASGRFFRWPEVCTVESELENGRVVRHTVRLDPETNNGLNDVAYTYNFSYDGEGRLKSEEIVTYYLFRKLNGKVLRLPFDTPGNDLYEFDTEGRLVLWTHNAHGWSEESQKMYEGMLGIIDPTFGEESAEYTYEYSGDSDTVRVTVTRKGESTTEDWPVEAPEPFVRTTQTEVVRIPVRKPLEDFATFGIESVDAFYPELPETLLGVTLPKPDGSRRLVAIITEKGYIPIQTAIQYDENGMPILQALFFEPGGSHREEEEYDEQGRLIRMTYPNLTIEFDYAEDGKSYRSGYVYNDGGQNWEQVTSLEDMLVPDWIRIKDYEGTDAVLKYTKEGLVSQIKYGSMNRRFSYETDQGEDGSLRILYHILEKDYDKDYKYTMLEFDAHGYLLYFGEPASLNSPRFRYLYEDLP